MDPSGRLGVPTVMKVIAVFSASEISFVALSFRVLVERLSSFSSCGSWNGGVPFRTLSILSVSMSIPTVSMPLEANVTAAQRPTYPRPMMETLCVLRFISGFRVECQKS